MPTVTPFARAIDLTSSDEGRRRTLRALARAMPDEAAFICDALRLARLCPRAACRRTDRCHGDPRGCLDTKGERVPVEAYDFAVQLAQARQDGEPPDGMEELYPEEGAAWRCWIAALDARLTRR